MRPGGWLSLGAVGWVVMAVASAWAPLQPELINTGAACQTAPCGTLEDPVRWRQAWWLWSVGALVAGVAAAFVLPPRRRTPRSVLLTVVSAMLIVGPLAVLTFLVSVLTSAHGVATAAVSLPLVGIAVLGSWVRNRPTSSRGA